jgi:diguanylate cyclase (GGDEF)-like protein
VDVEVTALSLTWDGKPGFQTIFRDITERKAAELRLERMANYDLLTGLPNRSLFYDRLKQLILHAKRDAARFALLYIDLERFKEANGRMGHYFGDLLLKEVALRLTSCLRGSDTVARVGEDEFVVILSKLSDRADVAHLARRIAAAFERPFNIQDRECLLAADIGISLFPEDGETAELQLAKAEIARSRCKLPGNSPFQFYSPEHAGAPVKAHLTRSAPGDARHPSLDEELAHPVAS